MSPPGFRSALAITAFRRLCLAHGVATIGQLVLTFAVGVHVLAETRSGIWVSVTVALAFAPYALCSALAGVLADRRSRSAVLAGAAWVGGSEPEWVQNAGVGVIFSLLRVRMLVNPAARPLKPAFTFGIYIPQA